MKIFVDLDDTLYNLRGAIQCWMRTKGYVVSPNPGLSLVTLTEDPRIRLEILQCIRDPKFMFHKVLPFDDAPDAIARLSADHEVHAVTSRHDMMRPTRAALARDFPEHLIDVHFLVSGKHKMNLFKAHRVRCVVDDNPGVADQCAKERIHCHLLARPYNRPPERHSRFIHIASGMAEIAECLSNS